MAACVARYAKSVCRSPFSLGGLDRKNLFCTPLVRVPFPLTESAPKLLRFFENLLFVRSVRFPPFDVVEYPSRITNQPRTSFSKFAGDSELRTRTIKAESVLDEAEETVHSRGCEKIAKWLRGGGIRSDGKKDLRSISKGQRQPSSV
jgi:hypothetical protein